MFINESIQGLTLTCENGIIAGRLMGFVSVVKVSKESVIRIHAKNNETYRV
jgi:hypothetical protein